MGVRGLTTYIKNHEKKYLKRYRLHNCDVLLDGNSVASNLFIWSNIESAFGGDYDKFAKYVREFFKVLQKCEIRPLVVFDGGYEERKLKTVYSRMKDKYKSTRCAQPLTGTLNFPLFMRIVFREVLTELNIPFAQSDFEADDELAALARQLQCPVLSYDSDFYIYDVLYIPLPSLSLEPISFKEITTSESDTYKCYLDCKIYNVDVLIESFGGLDKSMLPLLAALLGNDYIKRSVFKAFYTNLKIPKGKSHPLQRRINAVMEWLRNETFESAISKILGRMKKHSRRRILRQLRKIVNGYIQCTSVLCEHLGISFPTNTTNCNTDISNIIEQIDEHIEIIDEQTESTEISTDFEEDLLCEEVNTSETSCEDSEDECTVEENSPETHKISHNQNEDTLEGSEGDIPDWLLDCARNGKIQSGVIDILSLKQYFFPPQVEDHSLVSSHFISLQILSAIVGLLLGTCDSLVKYWTRNGPRLDWYTVEPIYETASLKFPPCDKILEVSVPIRKAALLEAAKVDVDLSALPEEWHLFVVAILFWLTNMEEPVATESHLHTMVMCLVALYTVDLKIGMHRNKQTFTRKYKKFLYKVTDARNIEKTCKLSHKMTEDCKNEKTESFLPVKALANVSREDCVLIFETIVPYHHLSQHLKTKPKLFCIATVHAFALFQSCLFHLMVFNSVLGFPLKETVISRLYSGTFVYNMFENLSKRRNVTAYVETLFQSAPSLLNLYKALIHLLEKSLTNVNLYKRPIKSHKKKKKPNQHIITAETLYKNREETDEEIFIDENNTFSRLSLNT